MLQFMVSHLKATRHVAVICTDKFYKSRTTCVSRLTHKGFLKLKLILFYLVFSNM